METGYGVSETMLNININIVECKFEYSGCEKANGLI